MSSLRALAAAVAPLNGVAKGLLLWAAAGALSCSTAYAASFDCNRARTAVERTVCAQRPLSELDEYLGRYFGGALLALRHAEGCLVADQRQWLRTERDACADAACLQRVYLQRLAVLHSLQPGASALRHVALPRTAPLVWIVPPGADTVAAPRTMATAAFTAQGQIINEVAGGDGFVLRSSAGRSHLVLPLMLLETPSDQALADLARVPGAVYQVRGHTHKPAAPDQADAPFDAGQCRYVYRLAP